LYNGSIGKQGNNVFEFSSQFDADNYKTLSSLVKYNNGQFKSVKQASYLCKTYRSHHDGDFSSDEARRYFGVELKDNQFMLKVDAYMRWADYGSKSVRPVTWIFVMDEEGVVAQYKLGYVGDMRSGTGPDPTKTKLLWERVGEITPLVREVKQEVAGPESQHIGVVGSRIDIKGVIKSVISFDRPKFHYYDSGVGQITRINVDGNDVVYFGFLGDKGQEVQLKATIKQHGDYNGRKQTVIARPKLIGV
jgi:hypothetical protein